LKAQFGEALSNRAFKFNLQHYTSAAETAAELMARQSSAAAGIAELAAAAAAPWQGRCSEQDRC